MTGKKTNYDQKNQKKNPTFFSLIITPSMTGDAILRSRWRRWMSPLNTCHSSSCFGRLSWVVGEMLAVALLLVFLLPVVAGLEACPAAPSFCQHRRLPQPQIKNAKGAARKSGSTYLSGLMSKMFQSSGNLLQSGTLSLLLQRASWKEGKKEKWKGGKILFSCG